MSIVIEHLNYVYMAGGPYETKALNDVNLTIGDGEFVGLIGHTGSGKSTLVQHLNGLLMPTSGTILVDGLDLAGKAGCEGNQSRAALGGVVVLEHALAGEGLGEHPSQTAALGLHLHVGAHPGHGALLGDHGLTVFQGADHHRKIAAFEFVLHFITSLWVFFV